MKARVCISVLGLLLAPGLTSTQGAAVITAQSDYAGHNGNTTTAMPNSPYAETFTALVGGRLDSISVGFVGPQSSLPPSYVITFRDAVGGQPETFALATANASTAPLSGSGVADITASFSSLSLNLVAGQQYAFTIGLPGTGTSLQPFFVALTGSGYNGGDFFQMSGGSPYLLSTTEDIVFTVRVVPEPSVGVLALLGCILFCARSKHPGRDCSERLKN